MLASLHNPLFFSFLLFGSDRCVSGAAHRSDTKVGSGPHHPSSFDKAKISPAEHSIRTKWTDGDRIQVFSVSRGCWLNGVIVKTLRDGRLEVQYKDNQGMEGKKVFLKTTIENNRKLQPK